MSGCRSLSSPQSPLSSVPCGARDIRPLPCVSFSAKSHAPLACSFVNALTTARCRYQLFAVFFAVLCFRKIRLLTVARGCASPCSAIRSHSERPHPPTLAIASTFLISNCSLLIANKPRPRHSFECRGRVYFGLRLIYSYLPPKSFLKKLSIFWKKFLIDWKNLTKPLGTTSSSSTISPV